jgi:phage terminase large subunit
VRSKHYYSNVNETIQEEDDEEPMPQLSSGEIYSKLKAQHDRSGSFKFLQLGHAKPKKIKSICLESEPILEELNECNGDFMSLRIKGIIHLLSPPGSSLQTTIQTNLLTNNKIFFLETDSTQWTRP